MASKMDVLAMLDELATLTTLEEASPQSFKVRAYEKAKLAIQAYQDQQGTEDRHGWIGSLPFPWIFLLYHDQT